MNMEHSETAFDQSEEMHENADNRTDRFQHLFDQPGETHENVPRFRNLTVDNPEIIRKMREYHVDLTALQNTLCDVCLEQFPSIKTNEAGVCYRCQHDTEVPKLYSAANNMNPGSVPPELCVCYFVMYFVLFTSKSYHLRPKD